jgi:hypothetical protein
MSEPGKHAPDSGLLCATRRPPDSASLTPDVVLDLTQANRSGQQIAWKELSAESNADGQADDGAVEQVGGCG